MTIESPGSDEETNTINAYPAVQPAERGTGDGGATGDWEGGRGIVGLGAGSAPRSASAALLALPTK